MSNPKIQSASSVAGKETIYVDVDDEITTIIDKVQGAKAKVVALVLPKRSAVLQSIVNMKLLKRTADTSDKNLVLITTEAGLMPLAGAVGLHVANTPTSKPTIPTAPAAPSNEPEDVDEPLNIVDGNAPEEDFDSGKVAGKSIGELAAAGAASKLKEDDIDDSINMDDDTEEDASDAFAAEATGKTPKPKKDKKLHIPNFDSFRKKLVIGGVLAVVLVGGLIYALTVMPKATVTIKTDSSTITTNLNLTLDTTAKKLDADNKIIPATVLTQPKTVTQTVPASGQQNNGQKASGTVSVTNCTTDNSDVSLPAGTTITGSGHVFVLQSSVDLPFSGVHSNKPCQSNGTTSTTVSVTALKGGTDYNLGSGTSFTSSAGSNATITGSTAGGTDDITKLVTQADIDGATSKIAAADTTTVKQELTSGLQSKGLLSVPTTFVAGAPQVTTSAQAGATADSVTVTAITSYTMLGIQKSDLQTLVTSNVQGQLDKGKQVILDDGVANAVFTESLPATATGGIISVQTQSLAGPQLNATQLKTQLAGKKAGDVVTYLKQTPGVTDVNVKLGPFWVSSVPSKASHVTINIVKANG